MKTDAWMPLWIGDYLADTMDLTTAQHGAYLLLLMAYWRRRGPLPDNDEALASMAKASVCQWQNEYQPALKRFFVLEGGPGGFWRHKRVEEELVKVTHVKEARSAAGAAGASARWNGKRMALPLANASQTDGISQSHSLPPSQGNGAGERPSLQEVLAHADRIGLAPWVAEDWFNEMDGTGWKFKGQEVAAWKPLLTRKKTFWEADGRPAGPTSRTGAANSPTEPAKAQGGASVYGKIKSVEALIADAKTRLGRIPLPDRNLYPDQFAAARDKRRPIVDELAALDRQLKDLHKLNAS